MSCAVASVASSAREKVDDSSHLNARAAWPAVVQGRRLRPCPGRRFQGRGSLSLRWCCRERWLGRIGGGLCRYVLAFLVGVYAFPETIAGCVGRLVLRRPVLVPLFLSCDVLRRPATSCDGWPHFAFPPHFALPRTTSSPLGVLRLRPIGPGGGFFPRRLGSVVQPSFWRTFCQVRGRDSSTVYILTRRTAGLAWTPRIASLRLSCQRVTVGSVASTVDCCPDIFSWLRLYFLAVLWSLMLAASSRTQMFSIVQAGL